jgi:ABC-type Zn2+ transport system substrate-binding protein/surface adhesin
MAGLKPARGKLESMYQAGVSRVSRVSRVLWMLEELDAYLDRVLSRLARARSQANGGSF